VTAAAGDDPCGTRAAAARLAHAQPRRRQLAPTPDAGSEDAPLVEPRTAEQWPEPVNRKEH
jgi:hypothetical protein